MHVCVISQDAVLQPSHGSLAVKFLVPIAVYHSSPSYAQLLAKLLLVFAELDWVILKINDTLLAGKMQDAVGAALGTKCVTVPVQLDAVNDNIRECPDTSSWRVVGLEFFIPSPIWCRISRSIQPPSATCDSIDLKYQINFILLAHDQVT